MSNNKIVLIGSLSMALAVALGAFGAHGLESLLERNNRIETYETAVLYHFIHSLGIILIAILPLKRKALAISSMTIGIVLFCGSLYTLSITNLTLLGAVAPIGGTAFILSWLVIGYQSIKSEAF